MQNLRDLPLGGASVVNVVGDVGAGHVLGRYELLMPIASGGMATVWAARLRGTRGFQKIVAVKTMLPSISEDAQFEQMFLDEATIASHIRHPHVVQILDLGEHAGVLFLVMEWVDGEPLNVLMKAAAKKGGVPLAVSVRIAAQASAGLHAAHELRDEGDKLLGVVHRDVSPQNVLLTYGGIVKVVDFGIAKATAFIGGERTSGGQIKGKAAYMSPEQARGGQVDRRTDIFAMGIILYQLTTGRHPFRGESDVATMYNICSESPALPPTQILTDYPPSLEAIVLQALAKDPSKRFPTANDLLRALDRVMPETRADDDDVSAFIRGLLGARQEKRREALRAALRVADDRAAGRAVPLETDLSHSGFTPITGLSSVGVGRSAGATRANASADVPSESPSSDSVATAMAGTVSQGVSNDAARQRARIGKSPAVLVGLALTGGAALGIAIAVVRSPKTDPAIASSGVGVVPHGVVEAPARVPNTNMGTEAHPPVNPEDLPLDPASESVASDASNAAPKADAHAPMAKGGRAAPVRPDTKQNVPAAPSAAPKKTDTGTTFVPPVRNPGF
jgi:serine/threonine-protein kinase